MHNPNIFDADAVKGQNGSNGSNSARFVRNVDIHGIGYLNRPAGSTDKGISVSAGAVKQLIQPFSILSQKFLPDMLQGSNIVA